MLTHGQIIIFIAIIFHAHVTTVIMRRGELALYDIHREKNIYFSIKRRTYGSTLRRSRTSCNNNGEFVKLILNCVQSDIASPWLGSHYHIALGKEPIRTRKSIIIRGITLDAIPRGWLGWTKISGVSLTATKIVIMLSNIGASYAYDYEGVTTRLWHLNGN